MITSISSLNLRSMGVPDPSYPLIAILSNELQNRFAGQSRRSNLPPSMDGLGEFSPRGLREPRRRFDRVHLDFYL